MSIKWTGEPTPKELSLARKLVREGKNAEEIGKALNWSFTSSSIHRKLRKYGIPVRHGHKKYAHQGEATWIKEGEHENKF